MPRQVAGTRETLAAQRVREWRAARGLTQQDMAVAADLTVGTVAAWERGENAPRTDQVERLAAGLGISPAEFYLGPENRIANRVSEVAVSYGAGEPSFVMTQLYEHITGGHLDTATPVGGYPVLVDHLPHRACITFRVTDDGLPGYQPGDVLLVDVSRTQPESGELVLAAIGGSEAKVYRATLHYGRMGIARDPVRGAILDGYTVLGIVVDLVHRSRRAL